LVFVEIHVGSVRGKTGRPMAGPRAAVAAGWGSRRARAGPPFSPMRGPRAKPTSSPGKRSAPGTAASRVPHRPPRVRFAYPGYGGCAPYTRAEPPHGPPALTRKPARPDPAEDALRRELYLFALYRTLEAALLALMVFSPFGGLIGEPRDPFLAKAVAVAYLPMALALLLATRRDHSSLGWQACLGVGVDIAVAALITPAVPGSAPGVA